MDTFLSPHVVEVVLGCFDLGCWTICNGTGWPYCHSSLCPPPPPPLPDLEEFFTFTSICSCVGLLFLLCLYICREPKPKVLPIPRRRLTPPPPKSPIRGRVSATVEVHTPTGTRTRQMRIATHTPLSTIKDGIPISGFQGLNLKDDLPRYRLFYDDEDEELDENKSLKEMQHDEDGITLKMKMVATS